MFMIAEVIYLVPSTIKLITLLDTGRTSCLFDQYSLSHGYWLIESDLSIDTTTTQDNYACDTVTDISVPTLPELVVECI